MASSFLTFFAFLLVLLSPFQSEAMKELVLTGTGTASHLRMVPKVSASFNSRRKLVNHGSAAGHISFPIGALPVGPISIKKDHRNRNAVVVKATGSNGKHPIYSEDQKKKNFRQAEEMKESPTNLREKLTNGQLEEAEKEELKRMEAEKAEKTEEHSNSHGIGAKIEAHKFDVVIIEQLLEEAGGLEARKGKLNADWIYHLLSRVSLWQLKHLWEMFDIKEDDPRKEATELVEEHMKKVLEDLKSTKESQEQFQILEGWLLRASKILIVCDMFRHWENFASRLKMEQEEKRKEAIKKLHNKHLETLKNNKVAEANGDKHPSEDEDEEEGMNSKKQELLEWQNNRENELGKRRK